MDKLRKELNEIEARISWCGKRLYDLKYEREAVNRELWRAQARRETLQQQLKVAAG